MASRIQFPNGLSLEPRTEGDRFLGIAGVWCGETPLRDPILPWIVYAESEDGFRFESFRGLRVRREDPWTVLEFVAEGTWLPRVQEADMMGDSRIRTRRLRAPEAVVRWRFRPITERIWENEWTGLAMQVEVDCPGHPIHWLLEDTTWEIGGAAEGCTLIQQDVTSIDLEQQVRADSVFSTIECFKHGESTDGEQVTGTFPMDMMPRCAGASPLDFQVKGDVALALFAEKPGLTRARLEKFRSENVIHYTDRPFFPLTETAAAPERKLLVYRHPQPLKRHEWRNRWLDAFTEVRRRIHASYGFALEIPTPQLWVFLWNPELEPRGAAWTDAIHAALPEYKRLGYYDVFTHGVWEGTSNDPHSPHHNICCNYDYRYAPEFGGPEAMKRLFDAAHELGIQMWQWFGLQLDQHAPLWKEHPDWMLREANGDPWDGNYQILTCGRFRTGFRDYLLQRVKQVKDDTGLDNIFWDSYQNLGVTCVDWQAPDKAPQAEEVWRFQAELQRYGFRQRCEVVTIFGITNVGMYGFDEAVRGGAMHRRRWSRTVRNDEAFAWLDCSPAFFDDDPYTADKLSPKYYFWLLGHRSVPVLEARPWGTACAADPAPEDGSYLPGKTLADQYARVNHLYHAVLPHMARLRATEGGRYTLWLDEDNQPAVIWAFEDAEMDYSGPAADMETDMQFRAEGRVRLEAGHVYRLGERAETG